VAGVVIGARSARQVTENVVNARVAIPEEPWAELDLPTDTR
jgi:D-threo-aldose 1-dehydrogenase